MTGKEALNLSNLIVIVDNLGYVTLHEQDEDGNAGDLVASVWRDDWLSVLTGGSPNG